MSEWKLNRIRIEGFKAFERLSESYNSDLVVYDGPNGFGKTSLFDAKQVLFTGVLPRISAKISAIKWGQSKPNQSLFRHHGYKGDVAIIAEFINADSNLVVMRKSQSKDEEKARKPGDVSHFKLYHLESFDKSTNSKPIADEKQFWETHFGENFLANYNILHYLPQDYSPLLLPDESVAKQSRVNQIEHLFNLDELNAKLDKVAAIKKETKSKQDTYSGERQKLADELMQLTTDDVQNAPPIPYSAMISTDGRPNWDNQTPFATADEAMLQQAIAQLNDVELLIKQSAEVTKRYQNNKIRKSVSTNEFALAVHLGSYLDKLDSLKATRTELNSFNAQLTSVSKPLDDVDEADKVAIEQANSNIYAFIKPYFEERAKLIKEQNTLGKRINDLLSGREKLRASIEDNQQECPLCGFDYGEQQELLAAIEKQTQKLEAQLSEQGQKLANCDKLIQEQLDKIKLQIEERRSAKKINYNEALLNDLEANQDKIETLRKIVIRLEARKIAIPQDFSSDKGIKEQRITDIREQLLGQLEPESEELTEQAWSFFATYINTPDALVKITVQAVSDKKHYVNQQFNMLNNRLVQGKKKEITGYQKKINACEKLTSELQKIESILNITKNLYINATVGQIESLFHIYSGRLLQNYQCGLGVFIDMPTKGTQKNTTMRFITPRLDQHDATVSMSSGQTSALSLALFLALNKRYAEAKFVFIDDPTQCMDEINVASLSDLLRVELRDTQVVLSTHEPDISHYLTYRYEKAGLKSRTINLLERSVEYNQLA